jgi:hypothetical protein
MPTKTRQTKRNPAPEPETITQPAAPEPQTKQAEVPEWVNDTPRDIDYDLQMYEDHEGEMEHIALTRGEYIQIKAHLAAMRGYTQKAAPPPAQPAPVQSAGPQAAPQPTYEQRQKAGEEILERRRRENMAEIASRLHEFNNEWDSRRLLAFMNIVRGEIGPQTPFETFTMDLISEYCYRGVTPEYVEKHLNDFRDDFEQTVEIAREFSAKYAEVIKAATAAAAA